MLQNNLNGWLAVNKPLYMTSADVVRKIKRHLCVKKIGHAGTLDPMAVGVLLIAIGEATKTIRFCLESQKTYKFVVCFGQERSTDDLEGYVTKKSQHIPTLEDIESVLPKFRGSILQQTPQYSALKINGIRAYKLARKSQIFESPKRPVFIEKLECISVFGGQFAEFYVTCSSGTYVRSLAREISQALQTCGHVFALCRIRSGHFSIDKAVDFSYIYQQNKWDILQNSLMPVEASLSNVEKVQINSEMASQLHKGQKIYFDKNILKNNAKSEDFENKIMYAMQKDKLIALICTEGEQARPVRVFHL